MYVHKLLENASVIKNVTSHNLFLKETLGLSLKPRNVFTVLIPRPKRMGNPLIFTNDMNEVLSIINQCF